VRFKDNDPEPITWDSEWPVKSSQYKELTHEIHPRAVVYVRYQLHAYSNRQREEQQTTARLWRLAALAVAATILGLSWVVVTQTRERKRERQHALAEHQAASAERLLYQEQQQREETERRLLEQQLATQAAERRALELKSQLFANIGIMAGSYAHNIKNLLVRPNDLLERCLEPGAMPPEQATMLREVRETLGIVTERLQQILRTVRRDPTKTEPARLDLNVILRDLERTWRDLSHDRWKLEFALELDAADCAVAGDLSHVQQAIENLLFNARDATFEQRVRLREEAHRIDGPARRPALIAAAGWKGRVVLRTKRVGDEVVLQVSDNGAGMTEDVRLRCTEAHFSTKRDNAIFEGMSTGMGLGLSFVLAVLEHHHATLEIDSAPGQGTTFRARFPAMPTTNA
jgi:signal transduction histidine kinase